MSLYKIPFEMREASIIKRPSLQIKSPYVADIVLKDDGSFALAHTASLGCSGLCEKECDVIVGKSPNENAKCEYVIYLSISKNTGAIVGVHPKLSEICIQNALEKNYIKTLTNLSKLKREVKMKIDGHVDSRFDFSGIDENGIPFILEVKSVPLERNTFAIFPEGYRKSKNVVISERALKHVRELEYLKLNNPTNRYILCFVIQRTDVYGFKLNETDPEYKTAVQKAQSNGVEILIINILWNRNGEARFVDLPDDFTIEI